MSRGPIVAILEKDNAVEDFRTLMVLLTLLKLLKELSVKHTLLGENAVHGSDSDENAAIEGAFHFAGREQFNSIAK
jgi:nucleoside-diphosphate kinase